MMKLVKFALKLLPIITLYKGLSSGGAKLGPVIDMVGISLTQYEVKKITLLTMQDAQKNGGLVHPDTFSDFIKDNYYNNYMSMIRRAMGRDGWDLSTDLWGKKYKMQSNYNATVIFIKSAGPDKQYNTKDDIGLDFSYNAPRAPARGVSNQPSQENYPGNDDGYPQENYDIEAY
jgi:hypothetical protein